MQIQNGFVKIHRNIMLREWYKEPVARGVFLHLLLTAAYKDTMWNGVTVKRGQAVTSIRRIADNLGYTYGQVRAAVEKLKKAGEITTASGGNYTVISIVSLGKYQAYDESAAERREGGASGESDVFVPPTTEEVRAYCEERGNKIDAERFVDYYTSRGWSCGKYKMGDWRAAVRSWEKLEREKAAPKNKFNNFTQKKVDYSAVTQRTLDRLIEKWS